MQSCNHLHHMNVLIKEYHDYEYVFKNGFITSNSFTFWHE